LLKDIQPDLTTKGTLAFELPRNKVSGSTLVIEDIFGDGKIKVSVDVWWSPWVESSGSVATACPLSQSPQFTGLSPPEEIGLMPFPRALLPGRPGEKVESCAFVSRHGMWLPTSI